MGLEVPVQSIWGPVSGALIAGAVAILLWRLQEFRKARLERLQALYLFDYFVQALAECLGANPDSIKHIDMSILNPHIPRLLETKLHREALHDTHRLFLKWRSSAYLDLRSDGADHRDAKAALDRIHALLVLDIGKTVRLRSLPRANR